jgi:hypothetical protein
MAYRVLDTLTGCVVIALGGLCLLIATIVAAGMLWYV